MIPCAGADRTSELSGALGTGNRAAHLALCSARVFAVGRNFCNTTPSNTSSTTAFQAALTCQPVVGLRLCHRYPTLPLFSHILWTPRQTTCQIGPLARGQAFLRFKARRLINSLGNLKTAWRSPSSARYVLPSRLIS